MESIKHFLKMTGFVPLNKRKEFEQTFRFVFNQLPAECLEHNLTEDLFVPGNYHFYSMWSSPEALTAFLASSEFQMLHGAYQTLGLIRKEISGDAIDIKSFHVTGINYY